jgi:hypothetical protein
MTDKKGTSIGYEADAPASLTAALARQVRRGFSLSALVDAPELLELALSTGIVPSDTATSSDVARALRQAVSDAVETLTPAEAEAARALFDLVDVSGDQSVQTRRARAAQALGVGSESFRKHRQPLLIERLARRLIMDVPRGTPAVDRSADVVEQKRDRRAVLVLGSMSAGTARSLFAFLEAVGLRPLHWEDVSSTIDAGTPSVSDVVRGMLDVVQAIVVVLEPDDSDRRARSNAIFEAGFAVGLAAGRTVIVATDEIDLPSDMAALRIAKLNDSALSGFELCRRLQATGCAVDMTPGHVVRVPSESVATMRGRLSRGIALLAAARLASTLRDLHARGVAHGDLRPENVLVSESGHIRIADIGDRSVAETDRKAQAEDIRALAKVTMMLLSNEQVELGTEHTRSRSWDVVWQVIRSALEDDGEARPTAAEFAAVLRGAADVRGPDGLVRRQLDPNAGVELRVGERVAARLSIEQLEEIEASYSHGDERRALGLLELAVPDLSSIVHEELGEKSELQLRAGLEPGQ